MFRCRVCEEEVDSDLEPCYNCGTRPDLHLRDEGIDLYEDLEEE